MGRCLAHLLGTKRSCVSLVVFHKAVVVNASGLQILDKVDTSCPHCGPSIVETMEHIFYDYPLVQYVWRNVVNIMWESHAKHINLGPRKYF